MKIIQLSDFHFNSKTNIDECKIKVDKLFEAVIDNVNKSEQLIFCICGDVTDNGDADGYNKANDVLDYLNSKFKEFNFKFEFTPGNHDICKDNFIEFDKFIEQYLENSYKYQDESIIKRKYSEANLVLINSAFHKDYEYGALDLTKLNSVFCEDNNEIIIVTHHAILSRYDDDNSAIRKAYDLIKLIQQNKVVSVLHGHTHGYSDLNISNNCKIIGVGPMFKKIDDINNQFNLISIVAKKIDKIINYRYNADLDKYTNLCVYDREIINFFRGIKASEVYLKVVEETKAYGLINNFNMNIITNCKEFFIDMQTFFPNDIEIAKQWQAQEVPPTLYYNHGVYMQKDGKDGLEYVVEELNKKATSSRAIIPLINICDVIGSEDGFLPSLDIIQFGFNKEDKTELYITLYLRALEVNHFLRINLSEIYVMVQRIKEEIRSIEKLNISVFAFRAQYKETYSCFQKAQIDQLAERTIMSMVIKKELSQIVGLLQDKLQLAETVVHTQGLKGLYECIVENEKDERTNYYSPELINDIESLLRNLEKLQKLRSKTSDYTAIEASEKSVEQQFKIVICSFEKLSSGVGL